MKKLRTLEGLRGIAALLIAFYHAHDVLLRETGMIPLGGMFGAADRGVDLFFVLSGFIIMRTHAADLGHAGRTLPYLYKRACRIYPSVWLLTLLAAAAYALGLGGAEKAFKLEPWNVAASFLLLPQAQPALVNVTWTLTYEIFFYGLFALLIARPRLGAATLIAWQAAVALAAAGLFVPSGWLAVYYLRPICLEFGIGMACALLIARPRAGLLSASAMRLALFGLGTALFGGGVLYEGLAGRYALEPARPLFYGLGPGMLILALALTEQEGKLRTPGPLVWLGSISYALYLVNFSVISLAASVVRAVGGSPGPTLALGSIALSLAAADAFYRFVDLPLQRALRRGGEALFAPARSGAAHGGRLGKQSLPVGDAPVR